MNLELKFVLKSKLKSRAKLSGQDPGVCWTRAVAHSRLLAPTSTCAVGELDGLSPEGGRRTSLTRAPPPVDGGVEMRAALGVSCGLSMPGPMASLAVHLQVQWLIQIAKRPVRRQLREHHVSKPGAHVGDREGRVVLEDKNRRVFAPRPLPREDRLPDVEMGAMAAHDRRELTRLARAPLCVIGAHRRTPVVAERRGQRVVAARWRWRCGAGAEQCLAIDSLGNGK